MTVTIAQVAEMLAIVRKGKLVWFAIYCLIVGLICIAKNYGLF